MATQLLFPNQPPQFLTAPSYLLGRGTDCDILLPEDDAGISRHHARLERDGDGNWWLTDSSTNGTRVNEQSLGARHRLRDGDRIGIGAVQFTVSAPQSAPAPAVARAIEIAPIETARSSPTTITPRAQIEESLAALETPIAPIVRAIAPAPVVPVIAPAVPAQIMEAEIVEPTFAPAPVATPPEPRSFEPIARDSFPDFEPAEPPSFSPPQQAAPAAPPPQSAPLAPAQSAPLAPVHNPYAVPQSAPPYQQSMAPAPAPAPMAPIVHHAPPTANQKNSGLALICSFFLMGGGQIYNGQVGKGIGIFCGAFTMGLLSFIPFIGWLLYLPMFAFYIWNIVDAYNSAERINRDLTMQNHNQQLQNQLNQQQFNNQLPR